MGVSLIGEWPSDSHLTALYSGFDIGFASGVKSLLLLAMSTITRAHGKRIILEGRVSSLAGWKPKCELRRITTIRLWNWGSLSKTDPYP